MQGAGAQGAYNVHPRTRTHPRVPRARTPNPHAYLAPAPTSVPAYSPTSIRTQPTLGWYTLGWHGLGYHPPAAIERDLHGARDQAQATAHAGCASRQHNTLVESRTRWLVAARTGLINALPTGGRELISSHARVLVGAREPIAILQAAKWDEPRCAHVAQIATALSTA